MDSKEQVSKLEKKLKASKIALEGKEASIRSLTDRVQELGAFRLEALNGRDELAEMRQNVASFEQAAAQAKAEAATSRSAAAKARAEVAALHASASSTDDARKLAEALKALVA